VLLLAGTPIHDSDLRFITPLKKLTTVTLTGCPNVTEAALKKLKAALPDDCYLELKSELPSISFDSSSDTVRHDTAGSIELQRALHLQVNHHEEQSLPHLLHALDLLEHERPKDQVRIDDARNVLSTLLLRKKDYAGALEIALKSIAKYEKAPQSRDTYNRLSTTYNTAATALEHLDRRREAIEYRKRSQDADRRLGDSPSSIENLQTQ
jgi:tetratricopeptide (TPR) repeat protein